MPFLERHGNPVLRLLFNTQPHFILSETGEEFPLLYKCRNWGLGNGELLSGNRVPPKVYVTLIQFYPQNSATLGARTVY